MKKSDSFNESNRTKNKKLSTLLTQTNSLKSHVELYEKARSENPEYVPVLLTGVVAAFALTVESALKYISFIAKTEYLERVDSLLEASKFAYRRGWVRDEEIWRELSHIRNSAFHVYNGDIAEGILKVMKNKGLSEVIRLVELLQNE